MPKHKFLNKQLKNLNEFYVLISCAQCEVIYLKLSNISQDLFWDNVRIFKKDDLQKKNFENFNHFNKSI